MGVRMRKKRKPRGRKAVRNPERKDLGSEIVPAIKPCSARLANMGWCILLDGHVPPCDGVPRAEGPENPWNHRKGMLPPPGSSYYEGKKG